MSDLALPSAFAVRGNLRPHPFREALEGAAAVVATHFPVGDLHVLQARGGAPGLLDTLRGARVSTVDLDAEGEALDRLRTFDDGAARHQLAVCQRVLERLPDPQAAIRRLAKTLAPGGLLVVTGATPGSLAGLLGRLRPAGRRLRGGAGPESLKDLAAGLGLELVYEAATPSVWPQAPVTTAAWSALTWALRIASVGLWRPDLSDMVLVFRRD